MTDEPTDSSTWTVVINDEEQYSLWAADRPLPTGWHTVGVDGTRQHCLEHIERVWTDLRPKSLRGWAAAAHGER